MDRIVLLTLIAVVVGGCSEPTAPPPPPGATPLLGWGGQGSGDGEFSLPTDIDIDDQGNVFVLDTGNRRVQRFDSNGGFLGKFSLPPGTSNLGALGVAPGGGAVYVPVWVPSQGYQVSVYEPDGSFVRFLGTGQGGAGATFVDPQGLAVDEAGHVYVLEGSNPRVQEFDTNGALLREWSSGLSSASWDIEVDAAGNVYIVRDGLVQKFDTSGTLLTQWTYAGGQSFGVAADGRGNVFVTNHSEGVVLRYDSDGTSISTWGGVGEGDGRFLPQGVAVDAEFHVYVVDEAQSRVQKFAVE